VDRHRRRDRLGPRRHSAPATHRGLTPRVADAPSSRPTPTGPSHRGRSAHTASGATPAGELQAILTDRSCRSENQGHDRAPDPRLGEQPMALPSG
jgi:hypothetical protein